MGVIPEAVGVFFQIHGSKFKLHPIPHLGQACESRISHSVLLLRICKDPLNSLLAGLVHLLTDRRAARLFCHLHIFTPDVPGHDLREVLAPGT